MDWELDTVLGWIRSVGAGELANLATLAVATVGIFLTLSQLTLLRRQLRLEALIQITDSNREILALGFAHPHLWTLLDASAGAGDAGASFAQQRYLQLWTNHLHLMWGAHRLGMVSNGEWEAYRRDMAGLIRLAPFRQYWLGVARFYPRRFRRAISELLPGQE
ncbi:MAG: hypothetical protein H7A46_21280 [Verrucomicrobiales bacterium]|nr:hypothetical protein [Verrucomicrobiales bacterium]